MELTGLFDSFYEKLVLRDFLGKIVPGFLFICGGIFSVFGVDVVNRLVSEMTATGSIMTIGFSWILGCALQYAGEVCRLFKTHPPEFGNRQDGHHYWATFYSTASPREVIQAERLNVLKEACGNTAVAVAVVCVVSPVCYLWRGAFSWYPAAPLFLLGLCLAFCLWRMHVITVARYGQFVKNTIRFRAKNTDGTTDSATIILPGLRLDRGTVIAPSR